MSLYCSQFTNMFEIALPIGSLPEASASVSKAKSLNPVTESIIQYHLQRESFLS
ncbi:hypothetical protein GGTG_12738 [Gaeumannomyces tritici R3-111a-1]|uniref:Uncharacterized protein n=1 Tax=Gaeumannomyces tritici (strain R3-111a-1) TaxID=644352 RepID=J3PGV8_GAET3|nr:hypothetical protein GGTG_12738 [Gaeumannomyces tritici R3-111a-1]EJT69855.1 hypothetical protein GGTG_12738 [Gaeumannomyces tritici R3-111a-1]